MPKMHQEPMDFDWGLRWFWGYKEFQIVADSRKYFLRHFGRPGFKGIGRPTSTMKQRE
jgi:hypothetical protein